MKKLPREVWQIILEWKSNLERRERFVNATNILEEIFKRPKLITVLTDNSDTDFVMTYSFKAGSILCIDYTTVDKGLGFTVNVMTTYCEAFEEVSPTQVWLSATWPQQ